MSLLLMNKEDGFQVMPCSECGGDTKYMADHDHGGYLCDPCEKTLNRIRYVEGCPMRPMSRLGIRTDWFHVYSQGEGGLIGYYHPATKEFKPIDNWKMTFSITLIDELGLDSGFGW